MSTQMRSNQAKENENILSKKQKQTDQESVQSQALHPSVLQRAIANPRAVTPETILQLQQLYGNRAVEQLLGQEASDSTIEGMEEEDSQTGQVAGPSQVEGQSQSASESAVQLQAVTQVIQRAKPANLAAARALASGGYVTLRPRDGLRRGQRAGGFPFGNFEGQLPRRGVTYTEYDINPYNGYQRDGERIVVGSNGKYYYTGDHYQTFTEIT